MKYLLLSLLLLSQITKAQVSEYYVYLVKGNVSKKKANTAAEKVKQNQLISKDDIITLAAGAEVSLANKQSQFLVLNTAGTYKVADLSKKTHAPATGVSKKYIDLMWKEMVDPNHDYSKFKKENIAGVHGGVSRGDDCNLMLFPVNGLKTSDETIRFRWRQKPPASGYSISIMDDEGAEVANTAVKDTQQTISTLKLKNAKPGKYYWIVKPQNAVCNDEAPAYFELLTKEDENNLAASLIKNNSEDMDNQLRNIEALENNFLIGKALANYKKLVKKSPENKILLKSYIVFLSQYGFDDEAAAEWKNLK